MKRRFGGATAGMLVFALAATPVSAQAAPRPHDEKSKVEVGFVVGEPILHARAGSTRVAVPILTGGQRKWVVTRAVSESAAATVQNSLAPGTLVDYRVSSGEVIVPPNPSATFHTVLTKASTPVFDAKKYGPELAPHDGRPGDLVGRSPSGTGGQSPTTSPVGDCASKSSDTRRPTGSIAMSRSTR
jgi:hypothetical protein